MKFFQIFSRRSGKTAVATENWEVGDWAECVAMGRWHRWPGGEPSDGPRHGRIGRVTGVKVMQAGTARVLCLAFDSWPNDWFDASHFRKVNPRADEATAAEAEFTKLVRRKPAPALPAETIREFE